MHTRCRIIADENIPRVREWFAPLGEVHTLAGRTLTPADVADADILLVRSVTRVDASLLAGSRVRFVGTATIGTDHLDLDWLGGAGIAVASAPGSNAQSVVDYVLSALAALDGVLEKLFDGGRIGVIGLGNVGVRLLRRLRELGLDAVGYDPFVHADDLPQLPLSDLLRREVISLHVPLTRTGAHPTFHMLDRARIDALAPASVVLSAGRGAAIDNVALLGRARDRPDLQMVLDVWEGEPAIATDLLERVTIGTPHIAGYSLDGKLAGTRMLLAAVCRFLQVPVTAVVDSLREKAVDLTLTETGVAGLRQALLGVYDPRLDDAALRRWPEAGGIATHFDALRKNYPVRREIAGAHIAHASDLDPATRRLLVAAGFRCS